MAEQASSCDEQLASMQRRCTQDLQNLQVSNQSQCSKTQPLVSSEDLHNKACYACRNCLFPFVLVHDPPIFPFPTELVASVRVAMYSMLRVVLLWCELHGHCNTSYHGLEW